MLGFTLAAVRAARHGFDDRNAVLGALLNAAGAAAVALFALSLTPQGRRALLGPSSG